MVPGSQPASPRLMPRCLVVPQSNTVAEVPRGVLIRGWGAGPALGAHRHSGTDPRNSQRARRVALACEVVREDHITRSNGPQENGGTRGWHPPEAQRCGSPRPAERDLQNESGRRRPYISVRSCACSFPQRDHHARKGLLRAIADDEASGIPAPHASTGMCAENRKLIVVRTLLIDAEGTAELGESGAWQEAGCPGRRAGMP